MALANKVFQIYKILQIRKQVYEVEFESLHTFDFMSTIYFYVDISVPMSEI